MNEVKAQFSDLLDRLRHAGSIDEAAAAIQGINQFRKRLSTLHNIAYIRASIDTRDEYYQQERDYLDEIQPQVQELITQYYKELISSPYRSQLEERFGRQLFQIAELEIKTFSPEVMELLQKENKLSSEYAKLKASAQIEFQGGTYTLAQLEPFEESTDRSLRRAAVEAKYSFYEQNSEQFDRIFDELVKARHEIAVRLGYRNFVELGYIRMQRIGYGAEQVQAFRKQVRESIVPVASKLYERQAARIGVDKLKFHDESIKFLSGNATPKGSPEWIIENGRKMYEELSPETGEFFRYMLERRLMDLEAKPGKEYGGYCTFIDGYEAPFIFSNFNGTSGDIDVLTHEAGHAFQVYQSRHLSVPEYHFPTMEAGEIHSMSMEYFTWPWMELFFQEDTAKYKYAHLTSDLLFIPYGVAVDEFQHLVYENPNWTPEERKAAWKKLEAIYLPHRDYDGIPYLEAGGFWQKQMHIYQYPFYYIDYTLAQLCAFQFWKRDRENHEEAWKDYLALCKLGGSRSFLELVEAGGLMSPFQDGVVESVMKSIEQYLESVDDKAL
jgi:M3 family oligoendopeptidase